MPTSTSPTIQSTAENLVGDAVILWGFKYGISMKKLAVIGVADYIYHGFAYEKLKSMGVPYLDEKADGGIGNVNVEMAVNKGLTKGGILWGLSKLGVNIDIGFQRGALVSGGGAILTNFYRTSS